MNAIKVSRVIQLIRAPLISTDLPKVRLRIFYDCQDRRLSTCLKKRAIFSRQNIQECDHIPNVVKPT
jgi:hypothetical protein